MYLETDSILAVTGRAVRPFSSSKDNTVRLWKQSGQGGLETVGVGTGHSQSVGGVTWCGGNILTVVTLLTAHPNKYLCFLY